MTRRATRTRSADPGTSVARPGTSLLAATGTHDQEAAPAASTAGPAMDIGEVRKTLLALVVVTAAVLYFAWRLFFTLPLVHGGAAVAAGLVLLFCETMAVVEALTHLNNVRRVKIPELPVVADDEYPEVDVLIVSHNEPVDVLDKTLNGCNHLRYPDRTKVHVYLCDDANRPEMARLAARMGVGYFGFDGNQGAKAGNLNHALPQTCSPLVAVLDADMIPTSDFLLETVPHLVASQKARQEDPEAEPALGYVQTPQSFYNPDTFQRNLYLEDRVPNDQDYFYRSVNVARMHTGSSAFAGSNTVFSRQALEDVGGFATYSITEDFATSIEILGRGYRSISVDKELAHGLSPDDTWNFIKQRQRWSRGAAQVVVRSGFLRSGMPLRAKWNFFMSYSYWWTFVRRLVYILAPIVCVAGVPVADVTLTELLAIWLPFYLVYNLGLRYMSGRTTNSMWSSTVDTIQFPYLIWSIVLGTLQVPDGKFCVTSKGKVVGRNSSLRLAVPHMVLAGLTAVTAAVCAYEVFVNGNQGLVIVLFWTLYNLLGLGYAILYYKGRVLDETSDRVRIDPLPTTVVVAGRPLPAQTEAMWTTGLTVDIESDRPLPLGTRVMVDLAFKDYAARLWARVTARREVDGHVKNDLVIYLGDEHDRRQYLQILHDRDHSFARAVRFDTVTAWNVMLRVLNLKRGPVETEASTGLNTGAWQTPALVPAVSAGTDETRWSPLRNGRIPTSWTREEASLPSRAARDGAGYGKVGLDAKATELSDIAR